MWFFLKLSVLMAFFIWVRGTTPRLRMDQLMDFAWKFMLPFALFLLPVVVLWDRTGRGWVGWLVCGPLVVGAYVLLGRIIPGRRLGPRTYRYAPG
jgi:NADH-quinone oxidoreductase subunit H